MTRKDYELIAGVFYKEFLDLGGDGRQYNMGRADEWRTLAIMMANNLQLNNPRFNKDKFLRACGVSE